MLTFQEREERKKTIGASEIYKLLNFDNQDLQDLWEQKIGLQDYKEIDNDSIDAGNILEEDGLDFYALSNNVEIVKNERIANKKNNFIVCSLDAREKQTQIPIENKIIKETSFEDWKRKKSGDVFYLEDWYKIPKAYYCQIQIQIDTLEVEKGILNINTLTEEEVENPLNVVITDLHNKQLTILKNEELVKELHNRSVYFKNCVDFKKRPSELEYTNILFEKNEI